MNQLAPTMPPAVDSSCLCLNNHRLGKIATILGSTFSSIQHDMSVCDPKWRKYIETHGHTFLPLVSTAFTSSMLPKRKTIDGDILTDKDGWISGDMDYVIGYGEDTSSFRFDANLAV